MFDSKRYSEYVPQSSIQIHNRPSEGNVVIKPDSPSFEIGRSEESRGYSGSGSGYGYQTEGRENLRSTPSNNPQLDYFKKQ